MCGIAGICYGQMDPIKNIQAMNEAMVRRGPDAGGYYIEESMKVALGHRRLSILDLSEQGAQPMMSQDERYVMVYNGEIYNGIQLQERMITDGIVLSLRGTSDTELLLEAIAHYGLEDTLRFVKGMFAIALLDRKEKTLRLARDRMGEKPLYYGRVQGNLVFASDLNAMKQIDGFQNPINHDAMPLYFEHGYIPAPYTIYEGIYKLKQGTILEFTQPYERHKTTVYWDIMELAKEKESTFQGSEEEAKEELERLLKEAIQGQMVADVPLGAFLSGGIDSTLVVALMQSLSSQQVKTFTIGLKEAGYNEADIASMTSKHMGTNHEELYIGYEDVMDVLPRIPAVYGEPFADSSQIPTMLVSKMTREHVTVSLSGDGGDEFFCGYNTYLGAKQGLATVQSKAGFLPQGLRQSIGQLCGAPHMNRASLLRKVNMVFTTNTLEDYKRAVDRGDGKFFSLVNGARNMRTDYRSYPSSYLREPEHNLMLMDQLQYLPDDILTKVDRAAMYYSLETRIPLLDRDVMNFAWSLPLSYAFDHQITKKLLKNLLYEYVPEEMINRPKKGFSIPISEWLLSGEMNEWAESLMSEGFCKNQELMDQKEARKLWEQFKQGKQDATLIWYILMMQQWALTE
ncbi:MAG: asparagine synthase (glutamine-hydrolyzing) [Eubacteriales bacterium]